MHIYIFGSDFSSKDESQSYAQIHRLLRLSSRFQTDAQGFPRHRAWRSGFCGSACAASGQAAHFKGRDSARDSGKRLTAIEWPIPSYICVYIYVHIYMYTYVPDNTHTYIYTWCDIYIWLHASEKSAGKYHIHGQGDGNKAKVGYEGEETMYVSWCRSA